MQPRRPQLMIGTLSLALALSAQIASAAEHRLPPLDDPVAEPGEAGDPAAAPGPGFRAFALEVASVSDGRVRAGDRADVILKLEIRENLQEASQLVLGNLRVLALDPLMDAHDGRPEGKNSVVLEVTPKQAEILAVVLGLGKLSVRPASRANLPGEPYRRGPNIECAGEESIRVAADNEAARPASPCEGTATPMARHGHGRTAY